MPREIKFRAWDTVNKMMWLVTELNWRPPSQGQNIFYKRGVYGPEEKPIGGHDLYVKDADIILMQFTGLKDKNGKEIYENDLVQWKQKKYEISWGRCGFHLVEICTFNGARDYSKEVCFNNQSLANWREQLEVIGNIYENPDLCTETLKT